MGQLADSYQILKHGTLWSANGRCKGYAVANPGEAAKIDAYVAALDRGERPPTPALATDTGRGIVGMLAALAPTPAAGLLPPQPPITTLIDKNEPINLVAPATLSDYQIDGSADSAVLVHQQAHGTTLRRFRITRACALPWANSYARHGVYGKVHNLLLEDFSVACTPGPQVGQCFSMRMADQTVRRFHGEGAPHLIGYFQEVENYNNPTDRNDFLRGTVLFEDGDGSFTADTAVWLDTDTASSCEQQFVFRRCHFSGAGAWFVRCNVAVFAGTVRLEGCTLNGKPVTAGMTNVPPDRLSIV